MAYGKAACSDGTLGKSGQYEKSINDRKKYGGTKLSGQPYYERVRTGRIC